MPKSGSPMRCGGSSHRCWPGYVVFHGWIRLETLCDRSSVTFDLRQCNQPQRRRWLVQGCVFAQFGDDDVDNVLEVANQAQAIGPGHGMGAICRRQLAGRCPLHEPEPRRQDATAGLPVRRGGPQRQRPGCVPGRLDGDIAALVLRWREDGYGGGSPSAVAVFASLVVLSSLPVHPKCFDYPPGPGTVRFTSSDSILPSEVQIAP